MKAPEEGMSQPDQIFYGKDEDTRTTERWQRRMDIKAFQSYHSEMKAEMQFDKKAKTQCQVLSECLCFPYANHQFRLNLSPQMD